MPQTQLPIFPNGVSYINSVLAFEKRNDTITYFNGQMPVFSHPEDDLASFRMITAQFYINGIVRQSDIAKAFGVSFISVKRSVKKYREKGIKGFFTSSHCERKPRVLTKDVIPVVEKLLAEGNSVSMVGEKLSINKDTIYKAISQGRISRISDSTISSTSSEISSPTSKSQRSIQDSEAEMGMGATNTLDRVSASLGRLNGVATRFENSIDVSRGGLFFQYPRY